MAEASETSSVLRMKIFGGLLLVLVFAKFLFPLFAYDIPLGYDTGLYRYLFLKHGEALPPFVMGDVEPWALGHPPGLFFFTSLLIHTGLPVDFLIGWIWNLVPPLLLAALAWVTAKRMGLRTGILVLLIGLLSVPYFDGFSAMYWKTYAALFWMVLAFYLLEKRSPLAIIPAGLAIITHHQTGLLLGLSVLGWWVLFSVHHYSDPVWRKATLGGIVVLAICLLLYLPIFEEAIYENLKTLFTSQGDSAPAGSFPDAVFYLRSQAILLGLGAYGWFVTLRRNRSLSLWHYAVLWSFIFVVVRLFFYRRFFLHLDFFLLPFAAFGLLDFWNRIEHRWRVALVLVLLVQAYVSYRVVLLRTPPIDRETYEQIQNLPSILPEDVYAIAPENITPLWIRGWLPDNRVAGPGMLSLDWPYDDWERLLYGNSDDRRELLSRLQGPVTFILTPVFYRYYGERAEAFLSDPCLVLSEDGSLLQSVCSSE